MAARRRSRSASRGGQRARGKRSEPRTADAAQYVRLKERAREIVSTIPAADEWGNGDSLAEAAEAVLFSTLDLVAAVRAAPEPAQAGRTLTGELELVADHRAITLLLLLAKLGGMPYLREMAARAVKALSKHGVRSRSELLVRSLTEPEPAGAWKLDNEAGEVGGLWYAVTGADGGARVLGVVVEDRRATSATLDCVTTAEMVEQHIRSAAPAEREPVRIEWDDGRSLLAGVWQIPAAEAGRIDEATYLRPWVEIAVLRGLKPTPPRDEPVETVEAGHQTPQALETAMQQLGAEAEHVEIARHIWADFSASFGGPIPEGRLDEWVAAAALSAAELAGNAWTQEEVARACGVPEDILVEVHEEFWEIMDVDVSEESEQDRPPDLLDIQRPDGP